MEYSPQQNNNLEKAPIIKYDFADKAKVHDEVFKLLHTYPENFLHELFEEGAEQDYKDSEIMVATQEDKIIGCVFYNPATTEFNWMAVSPEIKTGKSEIGKKLFGSVFKTLPKGQTFFWYVNTEDSTYPGYPNLGSFFEPARHLYKSMGLSFTREENKFGEGAHAYKIEGQVSHK